MGGVKKSTLREKNLQKWNRPGFVEIPSGGWKVFVESIGGEGPS